MPVSRAFFAVLSIPFFLIAPTLCGAVPTFDLYECETLTGDEYYEYVSVLPLIPALESNASNASWLECNLIKIFDSRRNFREVFDDFLKMKANAKSLKFEMRPGMLSGRIKMFSMLGPSREFGQNWIMKDDGSIEEIEHRSAGDFPEELLRVGEERNLAARMAILEFVLKGLSLCDGYEQCEFLQYCQDTWELAGFQKIDGIRFADIVEHLRTEKILHPLSILNYTMPSPIAKRALYNELLSDDNSQQEEYYGRFIQEGLNYLKKHFPDDIKNLKTGYPWKQKYINETLHIDSVDEKNAKGNDIDVLVL